MTRATTRRLQRAVFSFSLLTLLATAAPLRAVTFNLLPPTLDPEINKIDIGLKIGFNADKQTSDVSGTMEADLGWEFEGDGIRITELTLTGGALGFTDLDFLLGLVEVQGRGLGGTTNTLNPPGSSVVTEGTFAAADHEMIINQGLFLVTGAPDYDLSENPFGGSGSGEGTVSLTEIGRVGNQVTYESILTLPIAFTDQQPIAPGSPIFIDIEVSGTLQGSGQFSVTVNQGNADFDVDSDVDGRDLLAWQRGHGIQGSATLADGDANSDTNVDAFDLAIWQDQFGKPVACGNVTAVPEPGTVALVLVLGSLLIPPRYNVIPR